MIMTNLVRHTFTETHKFSRSPSTLGTKEAYTFIDCRSYSPFNGQLDIISHVQQNSILFSRKFSNWAHVLLLLNIGAHHFT